MNFQKLKGTGINLGVILISDCPVLRRSLCGYGFGERTKACHDGYPRRGDRL
jgi:hypothetical protein